MFEFFKRKKEMKWEELVQVDSITLPDSIGFAKECRDIWDSQAFHLVCDQIINEQLKGSMESVTDNEHFKLKMASALTIKKLKEKIEQLSKPIKNEEDQFNPHNPL